MSAELPIDAGYIYSHPEGKMMFDYFVEDFTFIHYLHLNNFFLIEIVRVRNLIK